jgi:hypothetical protein
MLQVVSIPPKSGSNYIVALLVTFCNIVAIPCIDNEQELRDKPHVCNGMSDVIV